jgi:mevalonate kinase
MDMNSSTQMAPTFMVSAPGKTIVFGEHAAVYDKLAIAAAISLRSFLRDETEVDSIHVYTYPSSKQHWIVHVTNANRY